MRTAAFETSAAMGGVAIGENGALLDQAHFPEKLVHARELIPTLDRLLLAAGWRPRELDRLVVSIGPGSFTGLRIGLAAAKVLALELQATLIGVDSIDVLAADAPFSNINLVDSGQGTQEVSLFFDATGFASVGTQTYTGTASREAPGAGDLRRPHASCSRGRRGVCRSARMPP